MAHSTAGTEPVASITYINDTFDMVRDEAANFEHPRITIGRTVHVENGAGSVVEVGFGPNASAIIHNVIESSLS